MLSDVIARGKSSFLEVVKNKLVSCKTKNIFHESQYANLNLEISETYRSVNNTAHCINRFNISFLPRTRTSAYQGVRNASFQKILRTYQMNDHPLDIIECVQKW